MQEALFTNSPTNLILSAISLLLILAFPYTLGQKTGLKQYPKPLRQLVITCGHWNVCNIAGSLFFSGPDFGLGAKIVFGLQSLAWIQLGNAIYHMMEHNNTFKRSDFWKLSNALGGASAILVTILFCINTEILQNFSIFEFKPFHHSPFFTVYSLLFVIFVIPEIVLTAFNLLKTAMQTSDKDSAQLHFYMTASFVFFALLAFIMDFILPVSYGLNLDGKYPDFLQWFRISYILQTIICGQYFTSLSFKNKSYRRIFTSIVHQLGDSVISFHSDGRIENSNPAAQLLFKKKEAEMRTCTIHDLIPDLNFETEYALANASIKINNEQHLFNLFLSKIQITMTSFKWILLLSDQTNSLFYKQRIQSLNQQFIDYKQDLIRYQDRLDSSEKKLKERDSISSTLINALPFQFWSKNEQGVFMTQNIEDIKNRTNRIQMTDPLNEVTEYEIKAREQGTQSTFTSYEDANHKNISEDDANNLIKKNMQVFIYTNQFIPILGNKPPYKIIGLKQNMTEQKRLERERNLLREQKIIHSRLEELGTMCGAFAHDYKNILGSQIGFSDLAQELINKKIGLTDSEKEIKELTQICGLVGEAKKAAYRAKDSLEQLLSTLHNRTTGSTDTMVFSPALIIEDVIRKIKLTLPENIRINAKLIDSSLKILGQPASLDRILSNLANNAIYAMKKDGGTLTLMLEKVTLKEALMLPFSEAIEKGVYAKFTIADTGSGMDSGTLERIFSPFFTTKAPGEGLGLGLSSALRLLKDGKAHFTVQTILGEGTKFNLYWDLVNEKPESASCPPS